MSKTKINPELLLSKGLLPENLPPVFNSKAVWPAFEYAGPAYVITKNCIGQPALFNASKRGGQRRIFGIPHPAFIRDEAIFFEKHWKTLQSIIDTESGSVSKPLFYGDTARHVRITPHSELPKIRLRRFSRFKYCLVTDVSRFYPSVYTHSIPWAINGKMQSKNDTNPNSKTVYGNKLDFVIRQSQSKQTIGLSVGPDVSKLTAELLMAGVDREFLKRSGAKKPTFVRHVDDYWVAGNTYQECEKHLQNLRVALREYGLDINELKTNIVSVKNVLGDRWPYDLVNKISQSLQIPIFGENDIDTLDIINDLIDQATNNNDDGLIRYAIKNIDKEMLWAKDWPLFEHFLAQCAVQFPHSIDLVMRVAAYRLRTATDLDRGLWFDVARLAALEGATTGCDAEVLWSLWMFKELGRKIPKKVTDRAIENCGPLVLAFLTHCNNNNICSDRNIVTHLVDLVDENPLSGPLWPLTLEMVHLGIHKRDWLRVELPRPLRELHDKKISLIDWSAPPRVFDLPAPGGPWDDGDHDPGHAIEDYGVDYDEIEDGENEDEMDGF